MRRNFSGAFAPYIQGLIIQKQAFGFDYSSGERILYTFECFCLKHFPDENQLTQQLALKWAERRECEGNLTQLNRISVIRELARYINSIGATAYILPIELTRKTKQHVPHIYTKEELSILFKTIDRCKPSNRSPAKHLVVSVIFRMIYCCGLRPVEARRLQTANIDLSNGCVKILESKGHKDRLVMLSDDMLKLCRIYDRKAAEITPNRKYFFQSPSNHGDGMYSREWIVPTFRKFLIDSGLYGCAGGLPRLYDLRHTFATHRLYQWVREGQNVNACLAYLSEYMGHARLSDTAYYIHMVPEFYEELSVLHLDEVAEPAMEAELCE